MLKQISVIFANLHLNKFTATQKTQLHELFHQISFLSGLIRGVGLFYYNLRYSKQHKN